MIAIADFTRRDMRFAGRTRPVLCLGEAGPAVIVIHEVYGFTAPLTRFCGWIAQAGMRVYAPILRGRPDDSNPQRTGLADILELCVSREFTLFRTGRSSPVVDWLRPLAKQAHEECGGPGVGVIGMCLTGGFALSMAVDPVVLAPVLAQPSLPVLNHDALDISPADLDRVKARARDDGLTLRGYRFEKDSLCRAARFETLEREFGTAFTGTTLPDSAGNPGGMHAEGKPAHSVFTRDLIDAAGEPTRAAADEVIAFFKSKLAA
ncbi:dienelactone hydrolase family protein [Sphingomonas sp. LB-2]|uniref:dienelactone hydrolase family protein n=1 Tax=Sphingomonas caeni TaxID=2984949 RepID=UPI0022326443|nr:dienelactone hydrolase family protein [Sphingomonas caeni]MCW3847775.1 dienelactone hydrolase family protein [Sphingomonas caeni]